MKAILYKELLDLKNKLLELLIITGFFVILGIYSKNTVLLFSILIFMYMNFIIQNNVVIDDLAWRKFVLTTKVNINIYLLGKYVFVVINAFIIMFLTVIINLIVGDKYIGSENWLKITFLITAIAIIYDAIQLSMLFCFGKEKFKLYMIISFILIMGTIGIVMNVRDNSMVGLDSFYLLKNMIDYAYIIWIVSMGILMISYLISLFRQYKKSDMEI